MIFKPQKAAMPLKVASTYIGTIVGAGFASGQEVLKFFAYFGYKGILGALLSTLLFSILGICIMYLSFKIRAKSYEDLLLLVMGKKFGRIVDLILTIFLFSTLGVMLAGAGAIFSEHLGLAKNIGIILTMLLAIFTLLYGLKGIMNVNTFLVPIMLLLVLLISGHSIYHHGIDPEVFQIYEPEKAAASNWFLSVILYVGYNLILTTAILAPMGGSITRKEDLFYGGLIGGIGIGLLIIFITIVVILHFPEIGNYEVPMLYVTNPYSWAVKVFFAFVLWAEVFTTVIGNVYGFTARVSTLTGFSTRKVMIVSMILAVFFSQLGFSTLVSIIYPLLGYISMIFLVALIRKTVNVL